MFELMFALFVGFLFGYAIAHTTDKEVSDLKEVIDRNQKTTDDTIAYYKKLCKILSEENAEFRRKQ